MHLARKIALSLARTALIRALLLATAIERVCPPLGAGLRRLILSLRWIAARWLRRAPSPPPAIPAETTPPPETLRLPLAEAPLVSVIVPTYGQVAFTLRCLASIAAHRPAAAIEVIVVDDAHPGAEVAALARVGGIRLTRNNTNLGFHRSCNAAARLARGSFLLFLNNDTEVRAGWLDSLVALFAARPDAGMVGSKLLSDDGTLQEAGGILWSDGSGWNVGRGGDPDASEFNYPREVDYCSTISSRNMLKIRRYIPNDFPAHITAHIADKLSRHGATRVLWSVPGSR